MKKFLIIILKIIIFFIGWAICAGFGNIPSNNPAIWRLGAEAFPLVYLCIFSFIFWLIERKRIIIISFKKPILNVFIGIGIGIAWIGVTVIIMYLIGTLFFSGSNRIEYLSVWLFACFLNVIMQELLVRGYIYQLIKSEYNIVISIIVTTILFTVMHGGAFETGIVAVLNVITMSVFMSLILEYTGSLVAPILVHTFWNSIGSIILGGVSLADDYPHLMNLVFSDSKLVSGGNCKMEGSIVVLIMNVIFIIYFYILLKRKNTYAAE